MLNMHFKAPNEKVSIVIRPRCPKCKKEFMLTLNNYLPGGHHACYACGTATQFEAVLAEKLQKQIKDLETSIQEVFESIWSE